LPSSTQPRDWPQFIASRQATRIDPLLASGPIWESILAAGLGRHQEAIERIEQALRIEPDNPMALFAKTQVLGLNQQVGEAAALLPSLEAHPSLGRLRPEWLGFVRDLIAFLNGSADAGTRLESAATGQAPFPRWEFATCCVAGILARGGAAEAAS